MTRLTPEILNRLDREKRVNRVIDHINQHLAEDLSVKRLARVAAFSPFHFHRIFKTVTGENVFAYIRRMRVERAATLLKLNPATSVTEAALNNGFSSPAVFARAFKARFGLSASRWRETNASALRSSERRPSAGKNRKRGKPDSKRRKAPSSGAGHANARMRTWAARRLRAADRGVDVKEMPAFHVAYVRYVGPYGPGGISDTWDQFATWIYAQGLVSPDMITLGIPQDHPGVARANRLRYDCAIVVPKDFQRDRLVTLKDLPAGTYAVRRFKGTIPELVQAWKEFMEGWLPDSGFQLEDRPFYEFRVGIPGFDSKGRVSCDICMPVSPL